jgi:exonuclease SbcC
LGKDGVIALCVDDAGPELARLANELLLACYRPRFTVSIRTQIETVKKELREGFDVMVFDAETGQAKSVACRVDMYVDIIRSLARKPGRPARVLPLPRR